MGKGWAKLTIADQVLVNAMAVVAGCGAIDNGHVDLAVSKVCEVLPRVSRGHPYIEPIAEQADRLEWLKSIESPNSRREELDSIRFRAATKLADFFFWRLGEASQALAGLDRQNRDAMDVR